MHLGYHRPVSTGSGTQAGRFPAGLAKLAGGKPESRVEARPDNHRCRPARWIPLIIFTSYRSHAADQVAMAAPISSGIRTRRPGENTWQSG